MQQGDKGEELQSKQIETKQEMDINKNTTETCDNATERENKCTELQELEQRAKTERWKQTVQVRES